MHSAGLFCKAVECKAVEINYSKAVPPTPPNNPPQSQPMLIFDLAAYRFTYSFSFPIIIFTLHQTHI